MLDIKKYFSFIMVLGSLILITSCEVETSVSIEDELAPLVEKQMLFEKKLNQIVKKIDDLQVSIKKINTAPSKADNSKKNERPKRLPADPNYVHNIPQGDSYFKGNPNAKVTITEFFDFQ